MMKRLLPVAAAVVIGLSPSFASAQSKGSTVPATTAHANHVASNPWNANYATNGAGSIMSGTNLSITVGGGAAYLYVSKNNSPYYVMSGVGSSATGDQ